VTDRERFIDKTIINADPTQINILVLNPAGFPADFRSKPITPPHKVASDNFNIDSKIGSIGIDYIRLSKLL
jgi:hypothetical protein